MNIAFIQHPHEFKTNSAGFFRDWLTARGHEVSRIDRGRLNVTFEKFDLIVLFQADDYLENLKHNYQPKLIVPMLDEVLFKNGKFYRGIPNAKFLSFSKNLHDFLRLNGVPSIYYQYWMEPDFSTEANSDAAFFWERTPHHLSISNVMEVLGPESKIIYRRHFDPNNIGLEIDYKRHPNVSRIKSDWMSHEDFNALIKSSKYYICPRKWEGIGMTTLEALAKGVPVLGLNYPTLSEYLIPGVNGLFISKSARMDQNFDYEDLRRTTREYAVYAYLKSRNELPNLIDKLLDLKTYGDGKLFSLIPSSLTLRQYIYLANGI